MLPNAGQTAGPNGLKLFVDTHGWLNRLKLELKLIYRFSLLSKYRVAKKTWNKVLQNRIFKIETIFKIYLQIQ